MDQFRSLTVLLLYSLFVPGLFSSCTHSYYTPAQHNVPMFDKAGEAQVSFSLPGFGKNHEIQTAVSITGNISLQYNSVKHRNDFTNGDWGPFAGDGWAEHYYSQLNEGGVGYYKNLKNGFIIENYLGYGKGNVDNKYEYNRAIIDFTKIYLQPSVGYKRKDLNIAFSFRLEKLNYKNFRTQLYAEEPGTSDVVLIYNHPRQYLLENAFTLRYGYRFLKFQLQTGNVIALTNKKISTEKAFTRISVLLDLKKQYFRLKRTIDKTARIM
jgi:hypothetical protein